MSFLDQCNVIQIRTSSASPAQKLLGLRVVYSKKFSRATFFIFWGTHLVGRFLSYLPVKQIWRKSAVCVGYGNCVQTVIANVTTLFSKFIVNPNESRFSREIILSTITLKKQDKSPEPLKKPARCWIHTYYTQKPWESKGPSKFL